MLHELFRETLFLTTFCLSSISAKARNGVVVKTTYNCEGDQMEIACPAGETIRVVSGFVIFEFNY